ncbi:MAG: ABC transporter ATP-binding protein [Bacteroidota bacterium]
MLLQTQNLSKYFDQGKVTALDQVSIQLATGKTYAIVGESGSGKTTLARLIAGLERPDQGNIHLEGKLVASESYHLPPNQRAVGLVFQDYALFPHLTVGKNIAYGIAKMPNKQERVREMLALVNLNGYENRYPHELSGGQQQRVALARALAPQPQLLILDEPFSNLDSSLRINLRTELFNILQKTGVSSIFVTHDTQDALAVADEILILKDGQLLQQASPQQLYQQPSTPYVAQLFDSTVALPFSLLQKFGFSPQSGKSYYIRTRHFQVDKPAEYKATASVEQNIFMGTHYNAHLNIDGNELTADSLEGIERSTVKIGFNRDQLLVFDANEI